MEIGTHIKNLRTRRGLTQEELAVKLGVTPQAISKWERGSALPDIAMLPVISAFFGITIDALFSLSDDVKMDRIQNMLWDVRDLNPEDVRNAREFLLEKASREQDNSRPHELLSDMENHLAQFHREQAAQYAQEAINRAQDQRGAFSELVNAMGGKVPDWNVSNHTQLIRILKDYIQLHPQCHRAYLWLLDQLIDDCRTEEAEKYLAKLAELKPSYRIDVYKGKILWLKGDREEAKKVWAAMENEHHQDWMALLDLGDVYASLGQYDKAKSLFRLSFQLTPTPRFVDALESIAQINEIQGKYTETLSTLQTQLEVYKTDWNFSQGETADRVRREISRIQRLIGDSTAG